MQSYRNWIFNALSAKAKPVNNNHIWDQKFAFTS